MSEVFKKWPYLKNLIKKTIRPRHWKIFMYIFIWCFVILFIIFSAMFEHIFCVCFGYNHQCLFIFYLIYFHHNKVKAKTNINVKYTVNSEELWNTNIGKDWKIYSNVIILKWKHFIPCLKSLLYLKHV